MTFAQKLEWRLNYVFNLQKKRDFVLILPAFIKQKIYGRYPLLGSVVKSSHWLTLQKKGNKFLLAAGGFHFLIPADGFCEGDFFDIVYPVLPKDPSTEERFDGIEMDGPYEANGTMLAPGDVVIDAGANVGFFSVVASRKVGPTGKVFAFEPRREIIDDYLSQNLNLNDSRNVSIVQKALGKEKGEITFFINGFEGATIVPVMSALGAEEMRVEQTTLDAFVAEKGLSKVDYIKSDIEGAERSMLLGAEATIKKYKPKLSIRTYHLPDDPTVIEEIVKGFVPEYRIVHTHTNMHAWIQ